MSKTNSLRCPLCGKGRIADIPSGAEQSQYKLFALHRAEHPDSHVPVTVNEEG